MMIGNFSLRSGDLKAGIGLQESLQKLEGVLPQRAAESLQHFEKLLGETKMTLQEKASQVESVIRDIEKLEKSTENFEAFLVKDLIRIMRKSMSTEKLGPMGDLALETMDQAIAESFSQRKQMGISQMLLGDLARGVLGQRSYQLKAQTSTDVSTKEKP
ncbi:MAG TPA: hypothetical protein PLO61_04675 [Fimbriimonadaceae bacterium]|nr:hypothetical protein [Fimbriimonadaceae bacterium]HRJ32514.1 hypothetical protein [Fimbriimonadaceae bacterium]